ncbi:YoaK family protein [Bordetella trematum]|uniref:YoaK family protein n=1 Tax=Bordetella trematum TaxID=123899 RepID=UPI0039891C47
MPAPQTDATSANSGPSQVSESFWQRRQYFIGWYGLTAICALLDVVCFMALGEVFASMMTGNLLLLAASVGTGADWDTLIRQMTPIVVFSAGAVLGGRLLRLPAPWKERRLGFVVEWLLLVIATLIALTFQPETDNWAGQSVVALLGLAMGVHGAMVRGLGVADLATNVMTTTLASWMSDTRAAGGNHKHSARRGMSIAVCLCSGVLGAVLWKWNGLQAPLVMATLLMTLLLYPLLNGIRPDN